MENKKINKKAAVATGAAIVGIFLVLAAGVFISNFNEGISGFAVTQFTIMGVTVESDRAGYACFPQCTAYVNVTNTNTTLALGSPYNVTLFNVVDETGNVINFTSVEEFNGSEWVMLDHIAEDTYYAENHPFVLDTYQFRAVIEADAFISAKWNFTMQVQKGFIVENFTLDPYIDSIVLVDPANDTSITYQNFTFFYISSLDASQNCSLYLDGSVVASNASTANATNTTFSISQSLGDHYWKIGCTNSNNETGFSEERNITFALIPYGADSYEDDDNYSTATLIEVNGTEQQHTFSPPADQDWIKFSASAGSRYLIETLDLSNSADTVMYLYDTDGTTIIASDDDGSLEEYASAILFTPTSSGTYYAKMVDWDSGADNGSYSVKVTEKGRLVPYLISPASNISVIQNRTFTVSTGVSCVGGECDDVEATLDPKERGVNKKLLKMLEDEGQARVIIKLKDTEVKEDKKARRAAVSESIEQRLDERKQRVARKQEVLLSKLDLDQPSGKKKGRARAGVSSAKDFKLNKRYNTVNAMSGFITKKGFDKLANDSDVEEIIIDTRVGVSLDASVPKINADDVWNVQVEGTNITGAGQTVCVIDTGINYGHADFGGNATFPNIKVIGGYDFVNSDADPLDDHGHGSHVAGIVASEDSTYKGVAPDAKLVAIKSLDSSGGGWTSDIVAGIDWCVNNASAFNISVISMSLGDKGNRSVPCDDSSYTDSVAAAVQQGILVVAASGNEGYGASNPPGINSPACVSDVFSVGSTTDADAISSFTNRDFILDVLAPGSQIMATDYSGTHTNKDGTSMATPHVAGAAALLQQYYKLEREQNISTSELKHLLKFHGTSITDSGMTFNRIDVLDSLGAKGDVPTIIGAEPFFTTSSNPYDCGDMTAGQSCNYTWTVNATGDIDTSWKFFTIYEAEYDYNITPSFYVSIMGVPPPAFINVTYPVNESILAPGTTSTWVNITTNETAECRYSLTTSDFNFTAASVFTNTDSTDHSFNFSGLSGGNTYSLYYKCNASGNINSPGVYHRFSVNATPVVPVNDTDGDGVNDTADTLDGNLSDVTVDNVILNITIDGSDNLSQAFTGVKSLEFLDNNTKLVSFNYNFSEQDLNLSAITIEQNNDSASKAYVLVSGLNLTSGQTKSLFVDPILNSSKFCIKDAEVSSITEVSDSCTAIGETLISCPGSSGSYTCAMSGGKYNISGLSYSAVIEYNGTTLSIWDTTDSETKYLNQNITFYANYTDVSDNPINTTCEIRFNTTGTYGSFVNMTFNSQIHTYITSFNTSGTFYYNIRCDSLNTTDDFTVYTLNQTSPIVNFGSLVINFNEDSYNDTLNLSDYVMDANDNVEDLTWTYTGNTYLDISITNKIVNFSAEHDWYGSEDITFTATDPSSQAGSDSLNITVIAVNDPPRKADYLTRFANGLKEIVLEFIE